ncbi:MAG: transcriptional regulator [Halobacteriovoraceae bacterium]|nr:transcriptional regulator [Halobacteriovoraceae bacterium]|tara:strand:+ start:61 stop:618 length:558 start_codon:yes stop_codon:yes gene_type:complete
MKQKSLLLIDDDQDFLETMSYELEPLGFKTKMANSASTALEIVNKTQETFHYIVVDLRMGNESGLDLLENLRSRQPHAMITMLTAYGSIATTVEAMKRGCDNYLQKPCSIQELLAALQISDEDKSEAKENVPATSEEIPDLYRKEREYIDFVLKLKKGNISHAAKALGIKRQSLQRKLKKFIPKN